jgi:PKD repeat protein
MTRSENVYKSNSDRYTFCNSAQATILVSVHTNSVTDPDWDGSIVLHSPKGSADTDLAQAIHDVMYPYLKVNAPDPDAFRDFGLDNFASGVLLKSDMPSAMVEPLFMSHSEEAKLLVTPIYSDNGSTPDPDCTGCRRAQIAQTIHDGILSYFGPGTVNQPPTADFTYTSDDLTVTFTDASTDADGDALAWSWDFGDAITSTLQNPSHTYAIAGTYPVTLTVTDTEDATDSVTEYVTVSSGGGGGGTMRVSAIELSSRKAGPNIFVYSTFTIVDENGSPVSDATVHVTTTLPDTSKVDSSGLTGSDGTVTLGVKTGQPGTYTSTVTSVTHASFTYDAGSNDETADSITVP